MFSSKIKLKHFIAQVQKASKHFEGKDPAGSSALSMAIENWEGKHEDSDMSEYHNIGFLVCELLAETIWHWEEREQIVQDNLDEIEDELEETKDEAASLRDILDEIKGVVDRHN